MAAVSQPAEAVQTASVGVTPPPSPHVVTGGGVGHYSLYVGDLDTSVDEGQLYNVFNQVAEVVSVRVCRDQSRRASLGYAYVKYGTITSALVMIDTNGKSKCFGFVNFENSDAAASAVEQLNGSSLNEKVLYVGKAQKKSEREADLRAKFEQERASRFEKLKGANLYLKNLDDSVNDENLKELFAEYGTITSCKVMRDEKGLSKGSGFVAFSTPEEATRALNEMNGKLIGKKPLFVAVAQRKDERRMWLQTHFARMRPAGGMTPPNGGMPGFHNGAPRLTPQQVYFGQGAPGLIAPQAAGFGYQQQLMPGLRPGVGPNFLLPYQFQRQGQHGRGRRGGHSQHQQWNSGRFNANGRNGMHPSIPQGMMGSTMAAPFDAASAMTTPPLDIQRSNPVPPSTLASSLAFASPEDQHVMLGEQLFPLVERVESDHAGKVTGMLLEMDQTEVLHLIESPDALKKKVSEAMDVLRLVPGSVGDKLGSLNLNG